MRTKTWVIAWSLLLVAACTTPSPTSTPGITREIRAIPDCEMFSVRAYIDANENGSRDAEELPLSGVVFYVAGGGSSTPSGEGGYATFLNCWTTYVQEGSTPRVVGRAHLSGSTVRPETVPPGYYLTTEPTLTIVDGGSLEFGFAPADAAPVQ